VPDLGAVGSIIAVNFYLADRALSFRIPMRILWRRAQGSGRLPPGIGLGFMEEELERRDMILRVAHGRELDYWARETSRYPARLSVRIEDLQRGNAAGRSETQVLDCDISEGGIRIPTELPRRAGDRLRLRIGPPGALFGGVTLDGRVVWANRSGVAPGMGIQFDYQGNRQRRRVQRLISKVTGQDSESGS
jgi:Tfp pilus assembly protein PilZ